MGKNKKPKPEPPVRLTAREYIANITSTDPADWAEVSTGTKAYRDGYRYINRKTGQKARRPASVQQP